MSTRELDDKALRDVSVAELEAAVRHHNHLYWDLNKPEISDYDYDRLVLELNKRHPGSTLLENMGPQARHYGREVEHEKPMLSLDKCYDDQALDDWASKFTGAVVATPKLDGIAARLGYDGDGKLSLAATRGNGRVGEDITANALTVNGVPRQIRAKNIEVRGEIYMPLSVFKQFQQEFANPRNLAAGAIRSKDANRCRRYQLAFLAYDLVNSPVSSESDKLTQLRSFGFQHPPAKRLERADLRLGYEEFAANRANYDFELDGVVFKAESVTEQERLGSTAHHPRYAVAYKFQGDSGKTILEAVEWSVARTGAITPVACIRPVKLSGAMVSRASLHNAGFIEKLGLKLGAEVVVMRRGGVIPNVEFVATPGKGLVEVPKSCPSCGRGVHHRNDILYCDHPATCPAALLGSLTHFCRALDIQGFGEKLLRALYDKGLLRRPGDLYKLTLEQLLELERVGPKLAAKLLEQREGRRRIGLATFLRALGIPELGPQMAELLANTYRQLDRIRELTQDDLSQLESIGPIIARNVVDGLREESELIDSLLEEVTLEDAASTSPAEMPSGALAGKSFLFTGTLRSFDRKTAQKMAQKVGAKTPTGVTRDLDYLVVGDADEARASHKYKQAEQNIAQGAPTKIITEAEFLAILGESR